MAPLNDALYNDMMVTRKVNTDDTPVKALASGRNRAHLDELPEWPPNRVDELQPWNIALINK